VKLAELAVLAEFGMACTGLNREIDVPTTIDAGEAGTMQKSWKCGFAILGRERFLEDFNREELDSWFNW
jgi:hypothetical protein